MRLLPFLLVAACGKNDEEPLPPPISFVDRAVASEASASIDADSVHLLGVWLAFGQFMDLLLSDNTVRNTFYVNAGLGTTPVAFYQPCWSVPPPGVSFGGYDVDLSGCSTEGYGGLIHVEDTAAGGIVMTFQDAQFLDWSFSGGLAFENTSPRLWSVYPATEEAVPVDTITVTTDDGNVSLAVAATMTMTGVPDDALIWGGTVGDGSKTVTIASSYDDQPAECSCQTEGSVSLDITVTDLVVTVDLDDLEEEDNGINDEEIAFTVAGPSGNATFGTGETCGIYEVTFGGIEVTLGPDELDAGVTTACDGGYFDAGTCTRLHEAARAGEVTVEVVERVMDNKLTNSAADLFDEGICFTGY